jgi:hypothetical protein
MQASCDFDSVSLWRQLHIRWESGSSPEIFRWTVHSTIEKWDCFRRENTFQDIVRAFEILGMDAGIFSMSAVDYFISIVMSDKL